MESMNLPCNLSTDEVWRAWFRGLFWGEGCLAIRFQSIRQNGKLKKYHRPSIEISQARDNRDMLVHIQSVLGGTVYDRKSTYNSQGAKQPYSTWMIRDLKKCRFVLDILREETYYVDKKADQVQALHEFLTIAESLEGRKRDEETLERMNALMQRSNARLKK